MLQCRILAKCQARVPHCTAASESKFTYSPSLVLPLRLLNNEQEQSSFDAKGVAHAAVFSHHDTSPTLRKLRVHVIDKDKLNLCCKYISLPPHHHHHHLYPNHLTMARKQSDVAAADVPSHTAQQLPERLAERHDYVTSSADMNFHVRFCATRKFAHQWSGTKTSV